MCGIVGFTGAAQAAPILLDGLAKLEYRGYDSAGIAVQNAAGKIEIVKAKGRLRVLSDMTDGGRAVQGTCGIGHTRWATHGEPSVQNAHPHYSRDEKIAVVHNGIIENFQELKDRLINRGYEFASQTDTEVVAQLIDYYYTGEAAGDPLRAITSMMMHVRGSYALGVLFADRPGVVYAVRKDSPLIVGRAENGSLIASDVPALLKYTRTVYYIDNLEIACLTPDSITFYNIDREQIEKQPSTIEWDAEAAEKGGYEHFMMKEIHEQPAAVRDTISPRIKDGRVDLSELSLDEDALRAVRRVYIVGCGSAYHVGVAARYVMESLARLPVEVDVASEFRYRDPCWNRILSPSSSARAARPPTRWPLCACARSAACAPSASSTSSAPPSRGRPTPRCIPGPGPRSPSPPPRRIPPSLRPATCWPSRSARCAARWTTRARRRPCHRTAGPARKDRKGRCRTKSASSGSPASTPTPTTPFSSAAGWTMPSRWRAE